MPTLSSSAKSYDLTATNAVWIATANLHAKFPAAEGFTPDEIQNEVSSLKLFQKDPYTIRQHIGQHLVATKNANAKPRRMLTELANGKRRLFVEGDAYDLSRGNGPIYPQPEDLPLEFRSLLPWYQDWSRKHRQQRATPVEDDPLLALSGTWTFGDAATYLQEQRSGWEE
jgi:hypothetical protein